MNEQNRIQALISRFEQGLATEDEIRQLEDLIASGLVEPDAFSNFQDTITILDEATNVPAQPEWTGQFYSMLAEVKEKARPRQRWMLFPMRYAAIGALVLGIGLGWVGHHILEGNQQQQMLTAQVAELQESLFMSSIAAPSATARLKAVQTQGYRLQSRPAISTLIDVLHHDPSTSVRLAALEVLAQHLHDVEVEEAVLESITDEAPMIQLRVAELLVQQKASLEALDLLLEREDIDPATHNQLKESIELLKI